MSYVSPTDNSAPTGQVQFWQKLPGFLRQPSNIAIAASLGVHGLIAALVPVFPSVSEPSAPQGPRQVNLVELSAAEQNRLPDMSTFSFDAPSQSDESLPSLPPLSGLPPSPPPPSASSLDSYYNVPSDLPSPSYSQDYSSLYNLPAPDYSSDYSSPPPSDFGSPPSLNFPLNPPPLVPNVTPDPTNTGEDVLNQTGSQDDPETAGIDGLQTDGFGDIAANPPQTRDRSVQRREQDNRGSVSNEEERILAAANAYAQWQQRLAQEYPNLETTRPQKIAGNYPSQAQVRGLEGTALVGVLANSQGEIVDGPRLLVTSGSDLLDLAALNTIKARSFEAAGEPRAYQFEVEFQLDGQTQIASEPNNDADSEATNETQTSETPQESDETLGDRANRENEQTTDLTPTEREFANWVEGVKNSFPNLESQRAKLPATYPENIAAKKPPHRAVFFVLVDTDGTIAVKPRQVTQTGNQELDRLALDAIQKAADNGDLPETETPRAYYLEVEFQPPQSTQTEEEEKPQDNNSETPSPDAEAKNPDEPEESNDSQPQSQDTSETESDPQPPSPSPSPTPPNASQPQDNSQPQQQPTPREQSQPSQPQDNSQPQQQPTTREQSNPEDNSDRPTPSPSPVPTPNAENSDSEPDNSEMEETPEPEPEN